MTSRNPATLLLEIFEQWDSDIQSVMGMSQARGWNDEPQRATAVHARAWTCLGEVSRTITGLQGLGLDVSASLAYLPRWGAMAAGVGVGWGNVNGRDIAFPPDAMAQLRMLATLIEVAGGQAAPANRDLLGEVVEEAMRLLQEDETITGELRAYLVKLVREIRTALEDDRIGTAFDFADASERLWVAMHAASAQSAKEPSAWKAGAAKLLPPAISGVLVHMGTVGFDNVMKALSS
ncbi:hypothetical protein J2X60_000969 [Curtobacterium sp. 320]|uniref:hypothetical protein n=1 Tax=Curtobacterium sp. 320 TaxID=2817749 RepID=UPI00285BAA5C|nr:hypothetical protein [Curtobacterium sp. 320]MDR6572333.1 hypothetical protein [Curtobacterium sp. 320]